ncbi:MAG: hypothetical protein LBS83_00415 [Holosporales bacterium]|jgi:hypothetical protein|nr:hypothetical protein [Holosporales bacterium]
MKKMLMVLLMAVMMVSMSGCFFDNTTVIDTVKTIETDSWYKGTHNTQYLFASIFARIIPGNNRVETHNNAFAHMKWEVERKTDNERYYIAVSYKGAIIKFVARRSGDMVLIDDLSSAVVSYNGESAKLIELMIAFNY